MFSSIVVGTDGSETADKAVRQATSSPRRSAHDRARQRLRAGVRTRLREEAREVPEDMQWMVNPREDVDATLQRAAERDRGRGRRRSRPSPARATRPTRSSTSPRSSGADLIVVGNKGMTGAKRFLLGSVPNKVSHHAPCAC